MRYKALLASVLSHLPGAHAIANDLAILHKISDKPLRGSRGKPGRNLHYPTHSRYYPHTGAREVMRRQRQIAKGQLRRENGLAE